MPNATFHRTSTAPRLQNIKKALPTHSTRHLVITEQLWPNLFRVLNTNRGKMKFNIHFAISHTQKTLKFNINFHSSTATESTRQ
jgi:hypothetical protein